MSDILNLTANQLAGFSFDCACGKTHSADINKIVIGDNALAELPEIAAQFKGGKAFLFSDSNTFKVCGERVTTMLKEAGLSVTSYSFADSGHPLVPDEAAIGRLVVEIPADTALIVAIGSGVINDTARMLSYKLRLPYIIVATAPSMDGYASVVSPLIIEGYKRTYEAVYPYAIIGDTDIMLTAPDIMLQAGFGDILGKYTALSDWELSRAINDEYYCPVVASMMRKAIAAVTENAEGIAARKPAAALALMEALTLSGVAIGMVGNSRPASGAEHHFAHYWEIDALAHGNEHALHGNSVGAATYVSAYLYQASGVAEKYGINLPSPEQIAELLRRAGAAQNPKELGIDRDLFHTSVMHAMEVRPRYTILSYLSETDALRKLADELTGKLY